MQLLAFVTAKNDDWIIEKTLTRLSEAVDGIICVDDGSTDGTFEIMSSFDKVIEIIRNPVGCEWRPDLDVLRVFEKAGEIQPQWLMYVDSDDVLDKRFAGQRQRLLSRSDIGRYHFREVTLWGSNHQYRTDKPEWYARTCHRTPFLVRYGPELTFSVGATSSLKGALLIRLRRSFLIGWLRRQVPVGWGTQAPSEFVRTLAGVFWPSDKMDYTNLQISGYSGREEEVPLVRLHYHFADMNRAWRKHMNYALQAAIRQLRAPGEIPDLVNWASEKLDETGIELRDVDPDWGVL